MKRESWLRFGEGLFRLDRSVIVCAKPVGRRKSWNSRLGSKAMMPALGGDLVDSYQ